MSEVFNPKKEVKRVEQGKEKSIKKWILIDIGETTSWFKAKKDLMIFSEHAEQVDEALFTKRPNSTTHMIFYSL